MGVPLSQVVHDLGSGLSAPSGNLEDVLNASLNKLLAPKFHAIAGHAKDAENTQTARFGTLIHSASGAHEEIPADALACVIDSTDRIDFAFLNAAYVRIAAAKRLKKTRPAGPAADRQTTVTLGVILARDSSVPIDDLAEALDRLNRTHPDREWTDMIVVLSTGTINYAAQFPGTRGLGDYLPPAEGASDRGSVPIYVVVVIRATGSYTFNRFVAFLVGHLVFFSPGTTTLDYRALLEKVPQHVMTLCGYQYDLAGRLMPVPRQFYADRYLPRRPFRVEDGAGNLLATLELIPWQDGGVVMLRGKLPLMGLMIFLGPEALKRGGVLNTPGGAQLSYVLPIGDREFSVFLQRLKRQSNMQVKLDATRITVQQLMDEGTTSPFIARLYLGNLRLRDIVFTDDAKRREFDEAYELVMTNVLNARKAAGEISRIVAEHREQLRDGSVTELKGYTLHIKTSIDKDLQREVVNFLNSSLRALKHGMSKTANLLNLNIGPLFQKDAPFEIHMTALATADPGAAAYLRAARMWSERLQKARNDAEHGGWTLPKVVYDEHAGIVTMQEPEVSGQPVSKFVEFMMDKLCCFVEEVSAECLKRLMPPGISITEVPLVKRDPEVPERFRITIAPGGKPVWNISAHSTTFYET